MEHIGILSRITASGFSLAFVIAAVPAAGQFGGFHIPVPRANSPTSSDDGCPKGRKRDAGREVFGSILGQAVGRAASSAGVSSWVPTAEVATQLTRVIACRLDPAEQQQAAAATIEATRSAEVGSTATWTSATRDNVSGTSTVSVLSAPRDGVSCITVTDVIIVSGEETTANKRMCRPPGSARYSLAA